MRKKVCIQEAVRNSEIIQTEGQMRNFIEVEVEALKKLAMAIWMKIVKMLKNSQ